jgi:hypothetical protein
VSFIEAPQQIQMNQPSRGSLTPRSEEHMLGHGFYNKHSHEQGKANTYALPLIPEAIAKTDLDQIGDEFRIADYGSAQGQNSLSPMKTAIAEIKKRATKPGRPRTPPLSYAYRFATNDWLTLFKRFFLRPTVISWREGRLLFRQRHFRVSANLSAESHRVRLFRDCRALVEPQTATFGARFGQCGRLEKCAISGRSKPNGRRAFLQYRALEMQSSSRLLVVGSGADRTVSGQKV